MCTCTRTLKLAEEGSLEGLKPEPAESEASSCRQGQN